MARPVIPGVPWWASPLVATLAVALAVRHPPWPVFLPVVVFVLWEIASNLELTLRAVAGSVSGRFGVIQGVMATLLGLSLALGGWWLLMFAYAGSCAARWYAVSGGRRKR